MEDNECLSMLKFVHRRKPLRPHRKSRLGCKECKARKIKCDEVRPVCGNCVRRFPVAEEECHFYSAPPRPLPSFTAVTLESTYPAGSPTSLSPYPVYAGTGVSRSTELRLFHHFATVTSQEMPLCNEECGRDLWAVKVPSIGFDNEGVYSAMLAIAACHVLTLNPDDVRAREASYHYIDASLSLHRQQLSKIDKSNAEVLLTASILITMHAKLRSPCLHTSTEPYVLPTSYFRMQEGIEKIMQVTQPLLVHSAARKYLLCYGDIPELHDGMAETFEFPDDSLIRKYISTASLSYNQKFIYSQALSYFDTIKKAILIGEKSQTVHRRITAMVSRVPKEFLSLLEDQQPLALAILARYYALMRCVEEPWWLRGTAEYEIRGLANLVPEDWSWAMEWPMAVL